MHFYGDNKKIPLKLQVADFEVYKSEQTARSATVLMLDLSLSMSVRIISTPPSMSRSLWTD